MADDKSGRTVERTSWLTGQPTGVFDRYDGAGHKVGTAENQQGGPCSSFANRQVLKDNDGNVTGYNEHSGYGQTRHRGVSSGGATDYSGYGGGSESSSYGSSDASAAGLVILLIVAAIVGFALLQGSSPPPAPAPPPAEITAARVFFDEAPTEWPTPDGTGTYARLDWHYGQLHSEDNQVRSDQITLSSSKGVVIYLESDDTFEAALTNGKEEKRLDTHYVTPDGIGEYWVMTWGRMDFFDDTELLIRRNGSIVRRVRIGR